MACPEVEAAYRQGREEADDLATDCTIRATWELMWQEGGPASQAFRIGFRFGFREALGEGLSTDIQRFMPACEAEIARLRRQHEEDVARGAFFARGSPEASPRVAALFARGAAEASPRVAAFFARGAADASPRVAASAPRSSTGQGGG